MSDVCCCGVDLAPFVIPGQYVLGLHSAAVMDMLPPAGSIAVSSGCAQARTSSF